MNAKQERIELSTMATHELQAYRRILRMSERCICDDPERNERHARMVDEILAKRAKAAK